MIEGFETMTEQEKASVVLTEISALLATYPEAKIGVWLKRSDILKLQQDAVSMPFMDEFHLGAQIRYGKD